MQPQPGDSCPSYGGGCARRAREQRTPYARPAQSGCPHDERIETGETGSTWMGFVDPRLGPSIGYREYEVCVCAACGERFGIAPGGTSGCAPTGL